jgi:hypothetical protein
VAQPASKMKPRGQFLARPNTQHTSHTCHGRLFSHHVN